MNGKKIFHGILVSFLLLSLAGCGGGASKKPDVTLIVKAPTLQINTIGELDVDNSNGFLTEAGNRFSASYDKANVTIQMEIFDYVDENAAITGAYGTEHAADILFEGYFNMAAYVSEGNVIPLDDIISDELRADISNATWAQSMKNGKTYMMPFYSMQNVMFYNKALFQQCGLERFFAEGGIIQDWTIDEWETILDTLAEKLPEDCYPMMMYANNNLGDTHIMSYIRSQGGSIFDEQGNFNFQDPEIVAGLKWIQDGVERGWYPPHSELLEMMDCYQLFTEGRMAIYMFNSANYSLYDYNNIDEYYGFVNFPGNIATSFITGFEIFDNGDPLKVEVAKDFLTFIYGDEELMSVSAGTIPESRRVAEKYADQIVMLPQFSSNADNVIDFMNSSPNWQGRDDSVRSVFWPHIHELLAGRVTPEECAVNLDRDCNAAIHVETSLHD